jgi:hypothetical protein
MNPLCCIHNNLYHIPHKRLCADITPQYGRELLRSLVFLTIPLAFITKLSITSPANWCPTSTTGRFLPSFHPSTPQLLAPHKRTASAEWERERETHTHTHTHRRTAKGSELQSLRLRMMKRQEIWLYLGKRSWPSLWAMTSAISC